MDDHSYSGIRGYSDRGGGRGGKGGHPWTIHRWSYLAWAYADICPSKVLGNTKVTVSSMDDSGLSTAPSDNPPESVNEVNPLYICRTTFRKCKFTLLTRNVAHA